jgi:hypothetical protein
MGGGHGNYTPAIALFPFGMLIALALTDQITGFSIAVALTQFPIYGLIMSSGSRKVRFCVLAGLHAVAVILALMLRAGSNFE